MKDYEPARELMLQIIRTRMAFRQALQRLLKRNNIDMTFEMLQVMNCLWSEQGVSQQVLAEKTVKDKACLTNLMCNLEKKGWIIRKESESDRRNRQVFLTPEGEAMSEFILPLIREMYAQAGTLMGAEEIYTSTKQLRKLDEILNRL